MSSTENKKKTDTKIAKLRKRSEGDKEKEEEELQTFDVESTAGGMGGSGG
jgi:hypothetical protein